jgi:hypothetical protein
MKRLLFAFIVLLAACGPSSTRQSINFTHNGEVVYDDGFKNVTKITVDGVQYLIVYGGGTAIIKHEPKRE